MTDAILFPAQIIKLQTMVDGAIRLTLDLPETHFDTARLLMECKSRGGLLEIAAVAVEEILNNPEKQDGSREIHGEIPARSEWESPRQTQEG